MDENAGDLLGATPPERDDAMKALVQNSRKIVALGEETDRLVSRVDPHGTDSIAARKLRSNAERQARFQKKKKDEAAALTARHNAKMEKLLDVTNAGREAMGEPPLAKEEFLELVPQQQEMPVDEAKPDEILAVEQPLQAAEKADKNGLLLRVLIALAVVMIVLQLIIIF